VPRHERFLDDDLRRHIFFAVSLQLLAPIGRRRTLGSTSCWSFSYNCASDGTPGGDAGITASMNTIRDAWTPSPLREFANFWLVRPLSKPVEGFVQNIALRDSRREHPTPSRTRAASHHCQPKKEDNHISPFHGCLTLTTVPSSVIQVPAPRRVIWNRGEPPVGAFQTSGCAKWIVGGST